jgi:hypothetical protein
MKMVAASPMQEGEPVIQECQRALVGFLQADLDLALTFVEIAKAEATNPGRSQSLINKARRALKEVRHLNGRVQDPAMRQDIHARANELEKALREAPESSGSNLRPG